MCAIGDNPSTVPFLVDQLESNVTRSHQVMEESRICLLAILDDVISGLLRETEIQADLFRQTIYATNIPDPSLADAVPGSNKVIIDLTLPSGPECSICYGELDGCLTNAYRDCGCLVCETCAPAN
ncbi:hypothetical protein F5Y16DRAFT_401948 [Xylariaceae sp. FL0255]|nr:hypothetical protein F5Y16DRAFT_401948 [Xylariaceae sp. FL0255]